MPEKRSGRLGFTDVFRSELAEILPDEKIPDGNWRDSINPDDPPRTPEENEARDRDFIDWVDARPSPLAALCLSGGGIRSASFALGALQALAQARVLKHFHYLSTVSGGGYIGSWLTAFRRHAGNDTAVFAALNRLKKEGREAPEIGGIRANSNYLTPRLGILSADTWAAIASYVRNLLLNWLVFGPLFLAVLIVPQFCARLLSELAAQPPESQARWETVFQAVAGVALLTGLSVSLCGRLRSRGRWLTNRWFLAGVLLPVVIAAICLTGVARTHDPSTWRVAAAKGAAVYAATALLGWILARVLPGQNTDRTQPTSAGSSWGSGETLAWIVSGAVVGMLIWVGCELAGTIRENLPTADRDGVLVVFGEGWVVLSILTGDLLYTGLASYSARGDMDQEWLARSGGWMAAAALSWTLLAAIDLYGPFVLVGAWGRIATLIAGGLSGIVALVFGSSAHTAATVVEQTASRLTVTQIVSIAAVLFGAFLAVLLSWVDARMCGYVLGLIDPALSAVGGFTVPAPLAMAALASGLAFLSLVVSVPVNVNRFSLHAVYRNRLIRAFLGSARASDGRSPDPFTGFDPADNLAMAETLPENAKPRRLLHVINVALNVVSTRRLAWQERKAEAFSVTALACGNPNVGYRETAKYGAPRGISLGTATAISGAAVSPNEGYQSSPLVGFLLMLFNLRLGWWLGNPRFEAVSRRSGPWLGLIPALQELAGATTDENNWVYLSDGGHFENLGIYEMVRRRCRLIVVSDAGCDPDSRLGDLGNAVRKCFIDFGVRIEFDRLDLPARPGAVESPVYCAIGRILYPGEGPAGWLLYVKPAYHGTEPADIRSYALAHPSFPHESTTEQWFSESQFEAYRSLGQYIFGLICSRGSARDLNVSPGGLSELREWAESYLAGQKSRPADSRIGVCPDAAVPAE